MLFVLYIEIIEFTLNNKARSQLLFRKFEIMKVLVKMNHSWLFNGIL